VSLSNTARWNQTIHRQFSRRSLTFIWIKIRRRRCHENASDCFRLDRCGGDAGDTGTCLLLTRLPSRRTMSRVQRSVPAILRSGALLWSTATLRSGAVLRFAATIWSALLRLRLGQPTWRSSTAGNSSWARRCRSRRREHFDTDHPGSLAQRDLRLWPSSDGRPIGCDFHTWTDEEIECFENRWPIPPP
jgi:hypothetical protein